MLRLSLLTIPLLLLAASPAAADSQKTTEIVVSFDEPVEAPAITTPLVAGEGPQKATEQIAAFDAPAEAAAITSSLVAGEGPQKVTEQTTAFEPPAEAPVFAAGTARPVIGASPDHAAGASERTAGGPRPAAPERRDAEQGCTCKG